MRGRARERLRALAVLTLAAFTWTGAALTAPVEVLRATDGVRECAGPVPDGATFHYRYVQSIYEVPVIEDLERRGDRIRVVRIRSSEIRAVEYYGWATPIRRDGDGWTQSSTGWETDRLVIRVSPPYGQRLDAAGWACDLEAAFPGEVVRVELAVRPAIQVR